MRVVIAARLSQLGEGQTGLDTQEAEAVKWAEAQGHEVVGIAADHRTGASHLWERANLKPWVTDTGKLAEYDALVCLKVDRLTRADDAGVSELKQWARDNHKQILISSAEVKFPSEGVEGLLWDAYIRMAHQEYLAIKERYGRMQDSRHEAGSVVGRAPWGYEVVKADGIKVMRPTAEGRIWVPKIFAWIVEGLAGREIAQKLEAAGVKSGAPKGRWYESTVIKMAHKTTYSGMRPRKARAALQVEPLVSRALQDKAIAVLAARARTGGTGDTQPKALLAKLNCGNPECPGEGKWPMYRITRRDQKQFYRCSGRGAQRQGCGAPMILVADLDALVLGFTRYWDARPYVSQRFVTGNDLGVRIERLRTERSEAIRVASSDEEDAIYADYTQKIRALEAEGSVQPHWEEVRTGETEGQHLQALDLDGQRDFLARKDIRAWKHGETVTVWIDGVRQDSRSVIADDTHPEAE
jgi:DNA invertase Pin-like site-specific DNA recombinase